MKEGGGWGEEEKIEDKKVCFFSFIAMTVHLLFGELEPTQSCALTAAEKIDFLKPSTQEV